ncbi:MAG: hypothetical protein JSS02_01560 [Planctomycetes bacterium]|nr:hypothetical protein [Planctomycetota bacterium]
MVDGSVRWITPEISAEVLKALGGPDLAGAAGQELPIVRPREFPVPADAYEMAYVNFGDGLGGYAMQNHLGQIVDLELTGPRQDRRTPQDADLLKVGEHPHLVKLTAYGKFTDAGTAQLATLTKLERLRLSSQKMSDPVFVFLKDLPNLRDLDLDRQQVTAEFVSYLQALSNLKTLELSVSEVTDDLPESLASLQSLSAFKLRLHSSLITDESLRVVSRISNINELQIVSDEVTDAGLLALASMTGISNVYISGKQVTRDGTLALQERLPNCGVWRYGNSR